jgi:pimeloyl-ACP methyl ester carboxylesterase
MAVEIILPRVDMDMATGKFSQWFVAEGAKVEKGQPLFEIETEKAAMEIEATASGILRAIRAKPGDELPVGSVVGMIFAPGEPYPAEGASAAPTPAPEIAPAVASPAQPTVTLVRAEPAPESSGLRATPSARRIARESGLDLAGVAGSGPQGRIQARDVAPAAAPAQARGPSALNRLWLTRGRGAPLVLIHGFGADLNGWRPVVGRLSGDLAAFALDLPGHGLSPLAGEISIEAMADAVENALGEEEVHEAHFIGHSLGGAVAIALAARRGTLARSLTLIAPAGLGPDINGDFLAGFLRAQSEASLSPWMRLLASDEAALGSAMVKTTLRQRRDNGVAAAQSALAAALFPDGVQAFSLRESLGRYGGPAKVIFGLEDRIIPASHARGLPGTVGVHLFAGVGHMPHFEARSEVALLIGESFAAGA